MDILSGRSVGELEAVIKAIPDTFFILDSNGLFLDYHVAGASPGDTEYIGKSVSDVFPATVAESFVQAIATVLKTDEPIKVTYSRKKDAHELFFEAQISKYGEQRVIVFVRDISEMVGTLESLKKSEKQFRSLVEHMSDILTVVNHTGTLTYISPSIKRISGFSPEELIGKPVKEMIHPDDRVSVASLFEKAFTHPDSTYTMEVRLLNKDGSWRYEQSSGRIEQTEDGTAQAVIVSHDITKRKKDELELRKFTRVIEQSSATIVITDRNGAIEYVNPAFERITGYTKEEAIGKNPKILKSGHTSKEEYDAMWKTILGGNTWKGEFLNINKAGQQYWENVIISPIFDEKGTITNFLAVKDDVTVHKMVEEEKNANDAILKRLISNLPGFIYRCLNDTQWTVLYMSEGVESVLGYTPIEFVSNKIGYGTRIVEDDRDMVWKAIQQAITTHSSYELTYRITSKSGELHWVWERGRGIFDTGDSLQYLEGFITDITQQKKAETALQSRKEELEQMNKLMIGRELRMRELKQELEAYKHSEGGT